MHLRHGDQETTIMDYHKWTWDFHRYPPEPKKVGFHVPQSNEVVEHISHWFIKGIEKYSTVIVNALHFYIKCVVLLSDKDVSILRFFKFFFQIKILLAVASGTHEASLRVCCHL